MIVSILLAAIVVCGDARDVPDPNSPTCPESQWGKLCGCGGTVMWDAPTSGTPIAHYLIERKFISVWEPVGTTIKTWWKVTEDRPLGFEGLKYTYRVWSVGTNGIKSLVPSAPVYLIGNPKVCVDTATWQKVSCWVPGGPGGLGAR